MTARVATPADADGVIDTLWQAFGTDPLWRWAFPDHAGLEPFWRLLIGSAMRTPWAFTTEDHAAASVWIPPGGLELTPEEEDQVEPLLDRLIGSRAADVLELLERFDAAHPHDRPHFYLSLLGTQPGHRGRGVGMALLAENLLTIDAEGMPAYLESSNPANDASYERIGFERIGGFTTPDGAHTVSTMWREPRSG